MACFISAARRVCLRSAASEASEIRPAFYGATAFAWLAEPKLTFALGKRERRLAERVGVIERVFAKPNVFSDFQFISRNRIDLAPSDVGGVFVRLPAFADFSISMALDMALDPRRSEDLSQEILVRVSRQRIASDALPRLPLTLRRHGANGQHQLRREAPSVACCC
jgi:hypothetical protein